MTARLIIIARYFDPDPYSPEWGDPDEWNMVQDYLDAWGGKPPLFATCCPDCGRVLVKIFDDPIPMNLIGPFFASPKGSRLCVNCGIVWTPADLSERALRRWNRSVS